MGNQTVQLLNKPKIISTYSIVGPKEGKGPLSNYFDVVLQDELNGKKSFEKAECSILENAISESIKRAGLKESDINYLLAGDLLNQITPSNFAARSLEIPFIGLYGACSNMTESLGIAAVLIDGGYANYDVAATSSHFGSAERQYRFPLEYGAQRNPTSQWTVTGAGAMVLAKNGNFPCVTHITTGKVKDYGINDVNNMGAAMAPAAVDTIKAHFEDTNRGPEDFDLIATGDLGKVGKEITVELLKKYGYDISNIYIDCGEEIFGTKELENGSGGSGCGCSAVVDCGYIYKNMIKGKYKRILIISTGALLSTTSSQQGESIPGIAHCVCIESK